VNSDCMNERDSLGHVLGKRALVYIGILAFAFVLLLVLNANSGSASAAGPTYVYEDISTDTEWTEADSPYIVNDSIEILPDVTLTIGPNVTVMVDAGEGITVSGTLVAQGTADEWINFTSNATTPAYGDWDGLYFDSDSSGSILSYVIVQYAWDGVDIVNTSVSISNVELVHNYLYGMFWLIDDGSDLVATVSNVNASDTYDGTGMFFMVDGGSATVTIADSLAEYNWVSAIVVQATGDVDVTISDTTVMYTMNVGVLLYSTSGNVNAGLSNIEVAYSYSFGVLAWAPNGDATVTVDPSEVSNTDDSGLQVEVLGNVELTVEDTTFTECYVGISVYSDVGPATVDLTNVDMEGCDNGLVVEVTNGDAIVNVVGTVINGELNGAFVNYYPEEVEAEYDIINPADYTSGSEMYVVLPFDFPYAGGVYDEVWVYEVGVISVGAPASGPFPVDIYSSSNRMIIPCQDYFNADAWPYYGYKVYDDRIVFQWYVWANSGPSYLKDVFEVVLYPSGDIQFNYADMETVLAAEYSYDYGLAGSSNPVRLNDIMSPNVYDMDQTSVYFDMERFNGGWGVYVEASGNVEATVTDSTIGHFFEGGVLLMSDDGSMSVEVMNSTIEYIMSNDTYGAGLVAWTYNGTMTATLEDSTFAFIREMGVALLSSPMFGGEETVTIANCTFEEVGYESIIVYTSVYDDGFNEVVTLGVTRTITDNTFTNAGGALLYTEITAVDSVWEITVTETMTGNSFAGTPPFAWFLGAPSAGPLADGMGLGMMASISDVTSYADGSSLEKTTEISGNSAEAPAWSFGGPEGAPLQGGVFGIAVESYVYAEMGALDWQETVSVTDNILTAGDGWFYVGILVDVEGIVSDGELNSTMLVDVSDNDLLGEVYSASYGIAVGVEQICEYGVGNGTMAASVTVDRNMVQNAGRAIYVWAYEWVYQQWGTQVSDIVLSVADNEIIGENTYLGIYVDIESYAWYNSYFTPYETAITSTQTTTFSVDVTGNWVDSWNQGIYVYNDLGAQEDYYGLFAHAVLDAVGTINISDNTVNMTQPSSYGIMADLYSYAQYGMAEATTATELLISGNTVIASGADEGYSGYGIYVDDEVWASTEQLSFDDAPMAVAMLDAEVTDNMVSGFYRGIYVEADAYSEYGQSSATFDSSVVVSGNEVSDVYEWGIYYYGEYYVSEYSYYDKSTNAVLDVVSAAEISDNVVSWVTEYGYPVGIIAEVYWDDWALDGMYLTADVTVDIVDNTVTGIADYWSEGIEVGGESELLGVFTISGNTIGDVTNGIDVWDCNVTISGNTIIGAVSDGIYLSDCIGTVSGNTVTGAGDEGIYAEYCWLLVIENNVVDGCGDGVYLDESWDSTVMGNTLTNNGLTEGGDTYGLVLYYCYNITVTENEITGNLYGMYVEYSDLVFVRNNTVNGNMHGGAEFYSSDDLIIEGNTFSENGGDGVWIYYCDYVIFGNNTANENSGYGLDAYNYYETSLVIYNGEYAENTYEGLYVESYYSGADWIVDAASEVRNNGVYFEGDVTIVSGGVLTLDTVNDFVMGYDYRDGRAKITVEEGGKLVVMNSVIGEEYMDGIGPLPDGFDYYEFNVFGTLDMESSTVTDAKELYLGPTSSASIRTSTIAYNFRNGIHIDDCSPAISGTTIIYNGMDGVFIEGANAAPKITDCLIAMNVRGVYAYKSNLANVVDNLIVLNDVAGIYAYDSDGKIHDNVMLFNKREIWIKDSIVSVQNNQIGYSMLVDVMAKYLPLLSMDFEVPIADGFEITPELMTMMMLDHIGIYAENSTVSASDNVYGMLTYAVYVVDSQLTFNDSVKATELTIPYFDSLGMLWNITVPIYVYDGIYASGSSVTINGGYIEVLDDAIFLEASTADVRNVVLNATDFDFYLVDGSTASATEVTFDTAKVEDTSVLTVNYKLTVIAVDQDGQPVGGVWIVVWNAANEEVAEGATGDDGMFVIYVVGYVQTSAGKSAAMNPYLVNASFDQGSVLKSVTVDGPTEVTVQIPVEKVKPIDMAPIVAITLLAIVLMVMLLLTVRGRP